LRQSSSPFAGLPELLPGHVWLVGAGPGDPGLMSMLAVHALMQADVVVHDALVDETCLQWARAGAEMIFAGKRGGKPSPKQRDISLRLVELARAGRRVLRLKGGDPFVFGRGGEEALTLVEHQVPFRIVPGITSGIGGLAYAGIPVTHRETNHTVTFLTGHDSSGLVPDRIDWNAVAKGSPVLVMYMAMKHIGVIVEKLLEAGRGADEPMAFVCNASTAEQRVLVTTLGHALPALEDAGLAPPAIVVLGEVVRLRAGLDWLGALGGKALTADPMGDRSDQKRDAG
jgi:uroporphyrin-III C-methyltransferase